MFPRDKTCGDGLTPRAIAELRALGLGDWLRGRTRSTRACAPHGFGQDAAPAVARRQPAPHRWRRSPDRARRPSAHGGAQGRRPAGRRRARGRRPPGRRPGHRGGLPARRAPRGRRPCGVRTLVVADGVRSPLGQVLGREWHRDTVYGVAGPRLRRTPGGRTTRGSPRTWSCAAPHGEVLSGYGWIFPLGNGEVNIGVGTLATAKRPADVASAPLIDALRRPAPRRVGARRRAPRAVASALLPMGGAVSGVAGAELGADRRRRRLRQPAQRRGHRLRPGDRPAGRRAAPATGRRPGDRRGRRCCASTTARRSRSPAGWPAC